METIVPLRIVQDDNPVHQVKDLMKNPRHVPEKEGKEKHHTL